MNIHTLSRLARPLALFLLLAGVLAFGANNAAWATPAQQPGTPVTVPPPEVLVLTTVVCPQNNVQVSFNVNSLGSDVTGYGTVTYVVNGVTRTAAFNQRNGNVANYTDAIPPANQASDRRYNIASAQVTLTVTGGTRTIFLSNPRISTANCAGGGPDVTPTRRPNNGGGNGNRKDATPTSTPTLLPGAPLPGVLPQPSQGCAPGAPQANVGPDTNATVANCPWAAFVVGGDIPVNGTMMILPVPPVTIAPPSAGDSFVGPLADIVLFDAAGNVIPRPSFASPVDICYFLGSGELAAAGGNPSSFIIQYYDTERAAWVALPTTVDAAGSRACTSVSHLTRFALTVRALVPAALPRTGAPAALPPWAWAALAASLLAVGLLALRGARRARG
jgi:hypothetical protein